MKYKLTVSFQKMAALVIALVSLTLSVEGASSSLCNLKKIPSRELREIENFFRYLVWNEQALFGYTLLGEKPLSVTYFPQKPPEQLKTIKHPMVQLPKWLSSWEKYQHLFKMNKFVLFSYKGSLAVEIYLLNKDLVVKKIQENHNLFKEQLEVDKTPEEILEQLLLSRNFFKEGLNGSQVLFGILLGYGTENSLGFNSYNSGTTEPPPKTFEQSTKINRYYMPLPFFAIFSEKETNDLLQSYSLQRKKILSMYSKGNFLKTTLRQLTT